MCFAKPAQFIFLLIVDLNYYPLLSDYTCEIRFNIQLFVLKITNQQALSKNKKRPYHELRFEFMFCLTGAIAESTHKYC